MTIPKLLSNNNTMSIVHCSNTITLSQSDHNHFVFQVWLVQQLTYQLAKLSLSQ